MIPLAVLALAFPAVALAATGGGGEEPGDAVGEARPTADGLEVLGRPVERLQSAVDLVAEQIEAKRLAEQRRRKRQAREERERFARLPGGVTIETLAAIAECESGGDPTIVSAGGTYRGKYQFSFSTWETVGGSGDPAAAPEAEQDYRAALLYARSGSGPWPVCG
ncbi:MAG: transglycosylase family protein [Solirubrobacterales bacterium]